MNTKRIRLGVACRASNAAWADRAEDARRRRSPAEWAEDLDGTSICSYPPEDLVIEDFGRYLKKKGKSIFSEERTRVEPFTTSLLDGIDLRETIRNWHEGKIFVREEQKMQGEVGSVVVIFDERCDERYPT